MQVDWVNDRFEDYENEQEWIEAYPDNPCPNCGQPEVGEKCEQCWPEELSTPN